MISHKHSQNCRSCGTGGLSVFLDLGVQPLANNLPRPEDSLENEPRFPLRIAVCESCWLVQITETVPPVTLFGEYLYFSSFSDAMVRHAAAAAAAYTARCGLNEGSFVVEIASNDGYLLKNFVKSGVPCLGVEPAANVAEVAVAAGVPTLCEFFGVGTAQKIAADQGKADLILGNNVFAHAPDINDFIGGLAELLKKGGRIVLEFPYLGNFIDHIEFDTIYHEHVFYFSVLALIPAFERQGLAIIDAERLAIHGGSLRLSVGHTGDHQQSGRLRELLEEEVQIGVRSVAYYQQFAERVEMLRRKFVDLLEGLKRDGASIAAYGASAKGSTLLNYFGIDSGTLDFVADRSTYKQGRLTPGTHLPIVAPEALFEKMPSHTVLLTWNFADEILAQQAAYREAGGKFIIPLPEPRIV